MRSEGEPPDHRVALWWPGPVLVEQRPSAAAQHEAQNERCEDRVVQLPRDRDDVRNEVEGHRQIAGQENEGKLAGARHAVVGVEASKEDEAIGNEARQRARFATTPDGEKNKNDDRVKSEERCEGCEDKACG